MQISGILKSLEAYVAPNSFLVSSAFRRYPSAHLHETLGTREVQHTLYKERAYKIVGNNVLR